MTKTLYHQTTLEGAISIIRDHKFRRSKSGWFGDGIYFAGSPAETRNKANHKGIILRADVKLGRRLYYHIPYNRNCHKFTPHDLRRKKHGSVVASRRGVAKEYLVFNSWRVSNISVHSSGIYLFSGKLAASSDQEHPSGWEMSNYRVAIISIYKPGVPGIRNPILLGDGNSDQLGWVTYDMCRNMVKAP
jgi:hypothetical protein